MHVWKYTTLTATFLGKNLSRQAFSRPKTSLTGSEMSAGQNPQRCVLHIPGIRVEFIYSSCSVLLVYRTKTVYGRYDTISKISPRPRYLPSWLGGKSIRSFLFSPGILPASTFRFTITNKAYSSTSSPTPLQMIAF